MSTLYIVHTFNIRLTFNDLSLTAKFLVSEVHHKIFDYHVGKYFQELGGK